jgi:excisionase family DNA binding protein
MNELRILEKLDELEQRLITPVKWLDIRKAAKYSSLSESTLHRVIRKGALKASRVTGKILIKEEWLNRFLEGK